MGLSICHHIITEHVGQIYVQSEPDKGTTFHIHLPVHQVLHQDPARLKPKVGKSRSFLPSPKVRVALQQE
jgi:hypothetical protein